MRSREFTNHLASKKAKMAGFVGLKSENHTLFELNTQNSTLTDDDDDDGGIVASPPGQGK